MSKVRNWETVCEYEMLLPRTVSDDSAERNHPIGVVYGLNISSLAETVFVRMALSRGGEHAGIYQSLVERGDLGVEPGRELGEVQISKDGSAADTWEFRSWQNESEPRSASGFGWRPNQEGVVAADFRQGAALATRALVLMTHCFSELRAREGGQQSFSIDDLKYVRRERGSVSSFDSLFSTKGVDVPPLRK